MLFLGSLAVACSFLLGAWVGHCSGIREEARIRERWRSMLVRVRGEWGLVLLEARLGALIDAHPIHAEVPGAEELEERLTGFEVLVAAELKRRKREP